MGGLLDGSPAVSIIPDCTRTDARVSGGARHSRPEWFRSSRRRGGSRVHARRDAWRGWFLL